MMPYATDNDTSPRIYITLQTKSKRALAKLPETNLQEYKRTVVQALSQSALNVCDDVATLQKDSQT